MWLNEDTMAGLFWDFKVFFQTVGKDEYVTSAASGVNYTSL